MAQVMIKAFDHTNTKVIDLLVEVGKGGNILKVFDYNGNELSINLDGTVIYNRTRWRLPVKVDLK
ncbi:TPA: hypothetical protein JH168_000223 [Acinetobacter baumannii]|uniref:hypothetical protein n=1 Tax=Acinetobacter baumannii TaxID=470 RepID=UPI0010FD11E3|nr:hypothetical protein [Acinetobacter baumannii]MBU0375586.1 hypothetical protein [Acinetobacter baumannii]MBU0384241.1 hypothetical protein [Acinetobacter baumannii]MBU0424233.1 hypothetical protein [Acinetobacter baumannii]MDF7762256.1 hypothetical protein [Acinetobacter baumannii]MTG92787.1 hypothetical protein [Acinetobacter baumannii]